MARSPQERPSSEGQGDGTGTQGSVQPPRPQITEPTDVETWSPCVDLKRVGHDGERDESVIQREEVFVEETRRKQGPGALGLRRALLRAELLPFEKSL